MKAEIYRYTKVSLRDVLLWFSAGGMVFLGVLPFTKAQSATWLVLAFGGFMLILAGAFCFVAWSEMQRRRYACVVFDAASGTVTFDGFRFDVSFWPERSPRLRVLKFSEIIEARRGSYRGFRFCTIRSTQGKVTIRDEIDGFESLVGALEQVARANEEDQNGSSEALASEPRIRTPLWGWIVIGAAVAGAIGGAMWVATK